MVKLRLSDAKSGRIRKARSPAKPGARNQTADHSSRPGRRPAAEYAAVAVPL
jgi:hypothetical protein